VADAQETIRQLGNALPTLGVTIKSHYERSITATRGSQAAIRGIGGALISISQFPVIARIESKSNHDGSGLTITVEDNLGSGSRIGMKGKYQQACNELLREIVGLIGSQQHQGNVVSSPPVTSAHSQSTGRQAQAMIEAIKRYPELATATDAASLKNLSQVADEIAQELQAQADNAEIIARRQAALQELQLWEQAAEREILLQEQAAVLDARTQELAAAREAEIIYRQKERYGREKKIRAEEQARFAALSKPRRWISTHRKILLFAVLAVLAVLIIVGSVVALNAIQTQINRCSNFTPGADLRKCDLKNTDLTAADLRGADLSNADLNGADLSNAYLGGADLSNADLSYANLGGANLSNANLGGANLGGADLSYANLGGADLTGAKLRGANLTGANLSNANLTGADLTGANLNQVDLNQVDLRGANLTGATCPWAGAMASGDPATCQGINSSNRAAQSSA